MGHSVHSVARKPDAVAIVAFVHDSNSSGPDLVLVRQFRPPMDAHTIELPAGLVDRGEKPSEAAIRELREETGYVGVIRSTSAAVCLAPSLASETISFVTVDVDLMNKENVHPVATPDEGEYVERILVPVLDLSIELDNFEKDGDVIGASLRTFAEAHDFGRGTQ